MLNLYQVSNICARFRKKICALDLSTCCSLSLGRSSLDTKMDRYMNGVWHLNRQQSHGDRSTKLVKKKRLLPRFARGRIQGQSHQGRSFSSSNCGKMKLQLSSWYKPSSGFTETRWQSRGESIWSQRLSPKGMMLESTIPPEICGKVLVFSIGTSAPLSIVRGLSELTISLEMLSELNAALDPSSLRGVDSPLLAFISDGTLSSLRDPSDVFCRVT
jgi:hypothetical protein